MFRQPVIVVLGVLITLCCSDRLPKPLAPGKRWTFPSNYCEEIKNNEQFDFVVVGGGPAGCTLARRLAENLTYKVLLIQAGGDPPRNSDIPGLIDEVLVKSERTQRWDWQSEENTDGCLSFLNGTCKYWYGKVLGGSSVFNFMMYTRGNHKDYDEWKALGNNGWGYNDILPYFRKLESYHGDSKKNVNALQKIVKILTAITGDTVTNEDKIDGQYHGRKGPLSVSSFPIDPFTNELREAFLKAVKSQNFPVNADVTGKSQIGFSSVPGMIDTLGFRDHAVKAYLQDIPKNLKICKNALVMKLNMPARDKKIQSVEFKFSGKSYNVFAKKEYILSAGGLGSPQILERSGIGIPDILKKAGVAVKHVLPGVGENMQDHFFNPSSVFTLKLNTESSPNPLTIGITSLTGFLNLTDYSHFIPDVQFILVYPGKGHPGPIDPKIEQQFKDALQQKRFPLIVSAAVLRQQRTGSVHITQATDPNLSPLIKPNIYAGERDIELAIKTTRLMRSLMQSSALKQFQPEVLVIKPCQKHKLDSIDEIICGAKQSSTHLYHTVGTAAMGPDNNVHVVNDKLKVHGIPNLRVVDSSIMPFVVRSNTEIPTIMIAEKGADLIKDEWNSFKRGLNFLKLFKEE